jgi:AdoMet-dependent rRNA methyltransferase SPB1
MVKQKKTDRDKWYFAAKEQGYRSRAAFKLMQLNKKFGFLQTARACLDLCAAPGGWLQVAAKYMPVSSIIIGVDLFPIRPIRNVITLKEDIRTAKCRHEIKKNLKGWKVDVCIHDGAPNLGAAWTQDAYGQNTLTLAAVGLAVDFLREGGTFVTKVFRSSDYNSLLWVFNQLFKKVTVTKPPASRGTSAEIFAVCEGFLAPKQLDPRFLDPKHVFKALDAPAEKELYFGQKRAKRHREGYDDGLNVLYRKAPVNDFLRSDNPTQVLANNHQLEFDADTELIKKDRRTSSEIQACLEDIQVLGRKEIKDLLRWRLSMRKRYMPELDEEKKAEGEGHEEEGEEEPMTREEEEKQIDEEIEQKLTRGQQRKRQKEKKERKKASKLQRRIDMKMDLVGDSFDLRDNEDDIFDLTRIKNKAQLAAFTTREAPVYQDSDSDDEGDSGSDEDHEEAFLHGRETYDEELESQLDQQYEEFVSNAMTLQEMDLQERIDRETNRTIYDSDSDQEGEGDNPLLIKAAEPAISATRRASQWFAQGLFQGMDVDESFDDSMTLPRTLEEPESFDYPPKAKSQLVEEPLLEYLEGDSDSDEDGVEVRMKADAEGFEVVPATNFDSDEEMNDYERAELLAMGTLIKTGKMKLSDLVDDGFNRYAFNDDDLPLWFADEEKNHNQPPLPITKEMTQEILQANKALNARPIKKVGELDHPAALGVVGANREGD